MSAHDKEEIYDFHYTAQFTGGRNRFLLNRNVVISGILPRRTTIPHSFYNVDVFNNALCIFTDEFDPDGTKIIRTIPRGNYDLDRLTVELTSIFASVGITLISLSVDANGRAVFITDVPFGVHQDSTTDGLLGYPDYPLQGLDSFFSILYGGGPNYILTSYRTLNLVAHPIIKISIEQTEFDVNSFGGYGTYIFQDFPDNSGYQFKTKRSVLNVDLLDHKGNPLELNGYEWFLEFIIKGNY